jgi:hypothetical protein
VSYTSKEALLEIIFLCSWALPYSLTQRTPALSLPLTQEKLEDQGKTCPFIRRGNRSTDTTSASMMANFICHHDQTMVPGLRVPKEEKFCLNTVT